MLSVLEDEDVLSDPVAFVCCRGANLQPPSCENRSLPAAHAYAPGGGHRYRGAGGVRLPPRGATCRAFHDLAPVVRQMGHGRMAVREGGMASPAVAGSCRQEADTGVHQVAHLLDESEPALSQARLPGKIIGRPIGLLERRSDSTDA